MPTDVELPIGKIITGAVVVILCIVGLFVLFGSWYSIPEGYVGVMFHSFGAGQGFDTTSLQQGWGLKAPFRDRVYSIPFRTQSIGFYGATEEKGSYGSIQPKDKNGITFDVDVTIRYSLDPTQAPAFIEQKGEGIAALEAILSTAVRADSTRGVFGKYAQEDVPLQRDDIAIEVKQTLQKRIDSEATRNLKPGFITIEAVDIRNIKFNAQIEDAIVNKQKTKQVAEQKTYELQQAETQKKIVLVQADQDKQAAILRAEGEGEAIKLVAFAKASGVNAINLAYQNMPAAYVQTQAYQSIKANDKIIIGLDSIVKEGSSIGFTDMNKIISMTNAQGTTS